MRGRKRLNVFVQFAGQGAYGMRAEAVSNAYLDPDLRLSRNACHQLLDLGWNRPTYVPSDRAPEPPDGSPNFYVDAAVPVPHARLASMAAASLRQVYGARHPGELEYSAYSADGASIRFPSLGLRRCDPAASTSDGPEASRDPASSLTVGTGVSNQKEFDLLSEPKLVLAEEKARDKGSRSRTRRSSRAVTN